MKNNEACLHTVGTYKIKLQDGKWFLDDKEITQEEGIKILFDSVRELGYWCQVAKDVLPPEHFDDVQYAYSYHEE